ncbi:hydroxyacid-oxoacid transhydrogenase, mitochondrial [Bombina bombina]|uniref:hydroxyacid-oxoacid transhydrogenase, mitochondrial n=1 Tax=Bombina bombina TaxID=8345 RepID=UPI00235B1267|nr:hydroxyacid-oxoacid transhydrogenase, mitochondrial [Bombina bombina]XP_053571064.1 hydroxyacid-oxoacid transhydrogenase, mitochondrial [Bombina bombina]XP_053571065.1 hydroxyacid-oxoacid transhydrogenase, mitochondrial [Bombina bombina]
MATAGRNQVIHLLRQLQQASCKCPAHSHTYSQAPVIGKTTEYAFEMAVSNIRYGENVTKEVGMDLHNMNARNVCVMTDKNLAQLPPVKAVLNSLAKSEINFQLYDNVRVEPTDKSFMEAIEFARQREFDAYVAVGGGSVMDTCKTANLYSCSPESDFLDYVNAPIGKGKAVTVPLKPLIAVPTTSGTGSETTGIAIFDYEELKAKTGIASRSIKPTLGLIDPVHTLSMPERVVANSGFDVLCHSLESYTALPYNMRSPCPTNPLERPAYQGSNPISDVWAKHALRIVAKYLKRAVKNPDDRKARFSMHLASSFAGIGFGNAGVHLCHGMSYPIAGLVKTYRAKDYVVQHPLVPHGLSVVLTSPAVFSFTASMCPERHLEAAEILGADIRTAKIKDAGLILAETLRKFLYDLNVDDGLAAVGYTTADIPALVKGTLPQERVTKLSPRPHSEEELSHLFEASMKLY